MVFQIIGLTSSTRHKLAASLASGPLDCAKATIIWQRLHGFFAPSFAVRRKSSRPGSPAYSDTSSLRGSALYGQVPRTRIASEYAAADVFVLPSLSEGMATVTLEALASGIPVVTTPNAGSCVRDGIDGFVVPVRDPEALADAIETIVTDRALRSHMAVNARARARTFPGAATVTGWSMLSRRCRTGGCDDGAACS